MLPDFVSLERQVQHLQELVNHLIALGDRASGGGGGSINSPIFVPAIGGNWDFANDNPAWGYHMRSFGGGPDYDGVTEGGSVGISFNNGSYDSPFSVAHGIFTVPDGVSHVRMIPVWFVRGAPGDGHIDFHGEMVGIDETGCETSTFAYMDGTVAPPASIFLCNPQFLPAYALESDAGAREVIHAYTDSDAIVISAGLLQRFFWGWQTYLT